MESEPERSPWLRRRTARLFNASMFPGSAWTARRNFSPASSIRPRSMSPRPSAFSREEIEELGLCATHRASAKVRTQLIVCGEFAPVGFDDRLKAARLFWQTSLPTCTSVQTGNTPGLLPPPGRARATTPGTDRAAPARADSEQDLQPELNDP